MHALFQAMHQTEAEVIGLIDAPDLEHVLRADGDAIPLAFATFQIDDRRDHPRLLFAVAR
ncbi:hypothetical protein P350_32650 [Burkholderia cepacia JBK9]|nr:hypothetical protein P350_32650 [Burkholderia cepacia JBK9]